MTLQLMCSGKGKTMKRYRIKKNIKPKLQGVILLILAYAAHRVHSDDAAVFFVLLGSIMVVSDMKIIFWGVYRLSKYIYRKGRWREI